MLDESALAPQVQGIADKDARDQMAALLPTSDTPAVEAVAALGKMMATARGTIVAGRVAAADMRRLVDLDITAAQVLQQRGSTLLATAGTTIGTGIDVPPRSSFSLPRPPRPATAARGLGYILPPL